MGLSNSKAYGEKGSQSTLMDRSGSQSSLQQQEIKWITIEFLILFSDELHVIYFSIWLNLYTEIVPAFKPLPFNLRVQRAEHFRQTPGNFPGNFQFRKYFKLEISRGNHGISRRINRTLGKSEVIN